jgi:hypothetical protein
MIAVITPIFNPTAQSETLNKKTQTLNNAFGLEVNSGKIKTIF